MNRLTQVIYPKGREVLAYNYADNRISREYFEKAGYNKERLSSRETYQYDECNRLVRCIEEAGEIPENRYAAEGLRHEMEENGRLVQFLYRGKEVVAEKEDDGNVIRYIRGYQLISSDNEKAKVYYHYASDELGSVTHIVNGNVKRSPYRLEYGMRIAGSESNCDKSKKKNNCFSTVNRKKVADNGFRVMNRYEYDAFGNIVKCEEKVHNRFRFAGEQYDPITQQYYLRARFYNPVIGRFIQEDNYYGDGLNLYAYCKNNPVRYVDPIGHGTTSAADKEANEKNAKDLKDYVDELNEQGGVTPEDAEVLKELAEEFDLNPNELDIQIKQQDTPVKPNDAGKADNQSIPSDENMITRYANEYGLESDSLGVSDGQDSAKSSGESASNTIGNIAKNLDTNNIPNMTKQEIIDSIPDNWKYTEHNGFVHIKDETGKIRIRIDPPDKVTQYPHVHVYDDNGNLLDSLGNIVDRKSPDGHIPYKN